MEDRREEKLVFKFISKINATQLKAHIQQTHDKYEITKIFDRSGYSPLHFAAYKNSSKICKILCEYILERGLTDTNREEQGFQNKQMLRNWIN
jgi:ankyrin repeat protein